MPHYRSQILQITNLLIARPLSRGLTVHGRVARVLVQDISLHLYVKNWMMGGGVFKRTP